MKNVIITLALSLAFIGSLAARNELSQVSVALQNDTVDVGY